IPAGKVVHYPFVERMNCPLAEERDAPGTLEKIEYPGSWGVGALDLLHFEFFSPGNHGTPYKLVDQHNHGHHGKNAQENGASITVVGSGLVIGAKDGAGEVAKLLDAHQGEP